jgi:hypothetical protein
MIKFLKKLLKRKPLYLELPLHSRLLAAYLWHFNNK